MESPLPTVQSISPAREKRFEAAVIVLIVVLLAGWLWKTPPGLLGKADAVGYTVCHRIPSRSFFIGDRETPVCARCSGMFLGALLGITYLMTRFHRQAGLPPLKPSLVLVFFVGAFALDGSNSYLHFFPNAPGLYEPNNILRLLTGTGVGIGIASVLVPVVHQVAWRTFDARPALVRARDLLPLIGLAALLDLAVLSEIPLLLYPLAVLSAVGILTILTLVYMVVWLMLLKRENRALHWRSLRLPLLAGFLTALLQIIIIDIGRFWLTGTWAGFNL